MISETSLPWSNDSTRLNAQLRWGPLGDLIRHSYSQRTRAGKFGIRLFAHTARLANTTPQPRTFHCVKQESEWDAIADIRSGVTPLRFACREEGIEFDVTLPPGAHTDLEITFNRPAVVSAPVGDDFRYNAKVLVRRQLCELRDNYLVGRPSVLGRTPRDSSPHSA